jgi:hypothetical protein
VLGDDESDSVTDERADRRSDCDADRTADGGLALISSEHDP